MFTIAIQETGMARRTEVLKSVADAAADLRPAFAQMEVEFRSIMSNQFRTEGGQGSSGTWRPLSASYAAWKHARFPGKTILRLTDRLFHSLVRRGPGSFVTMGPRRLVIGTDVPYAIYHQTGPRRRPIIAITGDQTARFAAIASRYLRSAAVRGAARKAV